MMAHPLASGRNHRILEADATNKMVLEDSAL